MMCFTGAQDRSSLLAAEKGQLENARRDEQCLSIHKELKQIGILYFAPFDAHV